MSQMASSAEVFNLCNRQVAQNRIEALRNRPESSPADRCRANHAVSEELKKQIGVLSGIRKSDNVDTRLEKIDGAINTLREQSKPLKKSLNSTLFSTDTELLELVAQTTREALMEIGGSTKIDPVEVGIKVATSLEQVRSSVKHYKPDESEWCDEWQLDEDEDRNELYNDIYGDSEKLENHRLASRLGCLHRYYRELLFYSRPGPVKAENDKEEEEGTGNVYEPAVFPFNSDFEFVLQLVDVERAEKQKKIREKVERQKKAEPAALVRVNDKASNVQSEEVSISKELKHVLKVLRAELKKRNTDSIGYFEFVTNPSSFSRTVENMFYVSYLMRDREVFLVEVNGIPTLRRPVTRDESAKNVLIQKCSWHGVTSLSYEQWVRLSEAFRTAIIEPLEG